MPMPPAKIPPITQVIAPDHRRETPFTPELLQELRLRCLSGARAARAMDQVGDGHELGDRRRAGQAGSEPAAMPANIPAPCPPPPATLGSDQSPADMRKLVEDLIAATRADGKAHQEPGRANCRNPPTRSTSCAASWTDVRKESLTDPLTGIANRKAFDAAMDVGGRRRRKATSRLAADLRHRPFQEIQRQLGPPDRRPGAAPGGELPVRERQGPRHRRALWRRGIRRGAARHQPGRRHPWSPTRSAWRCRAASW